MFPSWKHLNNLPPVITRSLLGIADSLLVRHPC